MDNKNYTSLRIPSELYQLLNGIKESQGKSINSIIIDAIQYYIDNKVEKKIVKEEKTIYQVIS